MSKRPPSRPPLTERKRQHECRRRKKLRADGFELLELWVPPVVRAGWAARERLSDPSAPLPEEHFKDDCEDVLVNWGGSWLRKLAELRRSRRDRSD